jgi:hypothetical protein
VNKNEDIMKNPAVHTGLPIIKGAILAKNTTFVRR